jgi:hypothetical protein
MIATEPFPLDNGIPVVFGEGQPEFEPLPALIYPDGQILIEWSFTDEERALIARGENIRHWISKPIFVSCGQCGHRNPCHFHPVKLEVTSERIA